MTDHDVGQVVRQLADLRMQVSALEVTAKASSLPEMLKQTRSTIRWSAVFLAFALIVSAVIRACNDPAVRSLEQRIEQLERDRKGK